MNHMHGLLIGGVLPALLFGFAAVLQKLANQGGLSTGWYLTMIGLGVCAVGIAWQLFFPQGGFVGKPAMWSTLIGISWAIGMACVGIGISVYGAPLAKLVPLYNLNTLISVALGLALFAEGKNLNVPLLLLGTVFVVIGGVIVARA